MTYCNQLNEDCIRPEKQHVYKLLEQHNALIVHFSGAPKGVGNDSYLYPNDLKNVINGKAQGGLACSTVTPTDIFSGFNRNATGCIGVILGLNTCQSLVEVSQTDCGSGIDEYGNRTVINKRKVLTLNDIEETILNRPNGYNEWIIKDYVVLGIFATHPFEISVLRFLDYPDGMPDLLKSSQPDLVIDNTNLSCVFNELQNPNIFGFVNNRLYNWCSNSGNCNHGDIYKI